MSTATAIGLLMLLRNGEQFAIEASHLVHLTAGPNGTTFVRLITGENLQVNHLMADVARLYDDLVRAARGLAPAEPAAPIPVTDPTAPDDPTRSHSPTA